VYARIADTATSDIQADVDLIESPAQQNLADGGSVYGAGGLTPAANGPSQSLIRPMVINPPPPTATNPFAKCRKIKNKRKRKRCNKKVRARLGQ
jgi:hypothetical protein